MTSKKEKFDDICGDEEEEEEEEDIEDEDDDDDMDEDEDDDDDEEMEQQKNEQEYETLCQTLEKAIELNDNAYESYVYLIKMAREQGDLERLRRYRQKMSDAYPLTETLWMDYIKDEQKLIETNEDRQKVTELYQKALGDYLSINIWLEYLQFAIGGMSDMEHVRALFKQAVALAGLHPTKGYLLWGAWRDFESAMQSDRERIASIFRAQLGVALDNIDATWKEFAAEFEPTKEDKAKYEKSAVKYKQIEQFEDALERTPTLEKYNKYIDFELGLIKDMTAAEAADGVTTKKSVKQDSEDLIYHKQRLKCLYERALADAGNCLDVPLWLSYINFLNEDINPNQPSSDSQLKEHLAVAKRAIRNCPFSAELWTNYASLLEQSGEPAERIKRTYNEAMNAGLAAADDYLQMWHAYLDFLRRQLSEDDKERQIDEMRTYFQTAINQLFEYWKHQGDPGFSLEKYWAFTEAKYFGSMEQARKIWNELIIQKSSACKSSAKEWLECARLEAEFGDEKHRRRVLTRALNEVSVDEEKQVLYEELLQFEKRHGNIQQYRAAFLKYKHFKGQLEHKKRKAAEEKLTKGGKAAKQNNHFEKKQKGTPKKVEAKKLDSDGFAMPMLPSSSASSSSSSIKPPASKKFKRDFEDNKKQNGSMPPPPTPLQTDPKCSVFLSNIDFNADENAIRAVFEKMPGFRAIRLIKRDNKLRGIGYVDFDKPQQAAEALKLDRTPVNGRPLFVSANKKKVEDGGGDAAAASQEQPAAFKYATKVEKNKLFVSKLPLNVEKKQLEDLFGTFGKLKDVRIVTHRNGKSKGIAYVEFEDEQAAATAIMQTDNMLFGDDNTHNISVAISNPPSKQQKKQEAPPPPPSKVSVAASLGSGVALKEPKREAPKNALSFVPRAQQINTAQKKRLTLQK